MYQFIRIGILYFQLKIVMLFIQFIVYTFVLPLISSYLLPHTLTSFISAAKHINAVTSSYSFAPVSGIWSRSSKVYWCMSSHFPHLFLFVHLSIIGSLLSFRYRQKRCYFIRPWPSLLDDDDCVCSPFILDTMAVWLACRSTHQICHVISTLSVGRRRPHRIDSTGQESCHRTTYCIYWRSLYSGCRWSGAWSPEMFTTSMERWCTSWWGWITIN